MDGCIYRTKDGECDLYADGGKYHAFCVGDAPCDGRKQSNADKIRQMSDEELAKLISDACPPRHKENRCVRFFQKGDGCQGCWLNWLKQEAERDG